MSRLAVTKGDHHDELRRIKDKSRRTQAFLSESKKVASSTIKAENTMADKSMKQTATSGVGGGAAKE
jgi:hypothetical protein